ncbi:MAG: hypothetical protein ACYDBB_03485 [Armatimonadota bacterium]
MPRIAPGASLGFVVCVDIVRSSGAVQTLAVQMTGWLLRCGTPMGCM